MKPHSVLISVATYNELENLPRLVEGIRQQLPQADILVVDDNSPDGTGDWCEQERARDSRLVCVHRPGKQGLGSAILLGLRYALQHDYEYVITMDADLSHSPQYLGELLAMTADERNLVDVSIGSRYVPGGRIEGWNWRRHCMSRAVNWYARCMLRLPVRDCSGAFRCYRTSALRRIDLERVWSHGYSVLEELLWRLKCAGAALSELPIVFVVRTRGESKIRFTEGFRAVLVITSLPWSQCCARDTTSGNGGPPYRS